MNTQAEHENTAVYDFAHFRFDAGDGTLTSDGQPIRLQTKTLELLKIFLESEGRVVSRHELIERLWPDTFVEENNLSQQIRALRKGLGDDRNGSAMIETIPRRGYRFLCDVTAVRALAATYDTAAEVGSTDLPKAAAAPRSRSRRWLFAIVGLLVIGAAAWVLWSFISRSSGVSGADQPALTTQFETSNGIKIADAESGSISPNGKLIVYSQVLNERESLWLRHIESGQTNPIGSRIDREYRVPTFAPDSDSVYFMSARSEPYQYDLNKVSVFGGPVSTIKEKVMIGFSISTAGIAFLRMTPNSDCELYVADLAGEGERLIGTRPRSHCYDVIRWSPDGHSVLASVPSSENGEYASLLVETNIDTARETPYSDERWVTLRDFQFLPGRNVWLVTGRKTSQTDFNRIWYVDPATRAATRVSSEPVNFNSLSLTADGKWIVAKRVALNSNLTVVDLADPASERRIVSAYGRVAWGAGDRIFYATINEKALWAINPDGSGAVQVDQPAHVHPAVSTDGKYIVTAKETNGKLHLCRMNSDGSDPQQLTFGGGEQRPNISHDNAWVYYESKTGKDISIHKVPFAGGEPVRVIDNGAVPSISPDGRSLAHVGVPFDTIYIVDTETLQIRKKLSLPQENMSADHLEWSADGQAIYLAASSRARIGNIWRIFLNGQPAQKLTDYSRDQIFDFALSPDRSKAALTRGNWLTDIVLIDTHSGG